MQMQCKPAKRTSIVSSQKKIPHPIARRPARPSCCRWCRISPYPRRLTAEGNDLCRRRSRSRPRHRRLWQQSRRSWFRGLATIRSSVRHCCARRERALQPRRKVTILSSQRFRETCAAAGTAAVGGYRDLSLEVRKAVNEYLYLLRTDNFTPKCAISRETDNLPLSPLPPPPSPSRELHPSLTLNHGRCGCLLWRNRLVASP